jgi:hypothetical protein
MTSEVKKTASKAGGARRIFPIRIKGWEEQVADAYGHSPSTRNWDIAGIPAVAIKKRNDEGTLFYLKKPVAVNLSGKVKKEDDGKIYFESDPESWSMVNAIETYILDNMIPLTKLGALPETKLGLTWGDNMVTLKSKWFEGKYTRMFADGKPTIEIPELNDTRVDVVLQFYGMYVTEDKAAAGPLASVKAFNMRTALE